MSIWNAYTISFSLLLLSLTIAFWGGVATVEDKRLSKEENKVREINRTIITVVSWTLFVLCLIIFGFAISQYRKKGYEYETANYNG